MGRLNEESTPPPGSAARSRAFASSWRAGATYRHLGTAFEKVDGEAEALAAAATTLFGDSGWLADLFAPLITTLRADPWFEPPLRVNRDGLRSGAILYERPGVIVGLTILSAAALRAAPPATTIVCSGRLAITAYLRAGEARLARWAVDSLPEPLTAMGIAPCRALPDLDLSDGALVRHDGRTGADAIVAAERDVVMLSAAIRAGADPVGREYDRATGTFLRMATNDEGAARAQILLTLLRAAGVSDAPVFDAATRDGAFFLRWSAMREWLGCDWRGAWPRLQAMAADDPHPDVRRAAATTIAHAARPAAA